LQARISHPLSAQAVMRNEIEQTIQLLALFQSVTITAERTAVRRARIPLREAAHRTNGSWVESDRSQRKWRTCAR